MRLGMPRTVQVTTTTELWLPDGRHLFKGTTVELERDHAQELLDHGWAVADDQDEDAEVPS
jgi:hypothetical protein